MSTESGANSVVLRPMPVSTVSAPLTSCRYSHRRPAPARRPPATNPTDAPDPGAVS